MPRFHLNLHECGRVTIDEAGRDYGDLDEARAIAVEAARDVMSHEVKGGTLCLSCCIVVEDGDGGEVSRVWFRDALELSGL